MDDDNQVLDRPRPKLPQKFSIGEMLKGTAATPEPVPPAVEPASSPASTPDVDVAETLPLPASPYEACSRPASKPLLTLHFLLADQTRESFSYGDLRRMRWLPSADPGSGPELVLLFAEEEVRLTGRQIDPLPDLLGRHAVAWLRQLPPRWDFQPKESKGMVITGIQITTLER